VGLVARMGGDHKFVYFGPNTWREESSQTHKHR